MACRRAVLVDPRRRFEIVADDVEVTVSIEVVEGRAEAHAQVVESPALGLVDEAQVALVGEGHVALGELILADPELLHRVVGIAPVEGLLAQVAVEEVAGHAVADEEVEPAVLVEIAEDRRPGPVAGGQAGEPGALTKASTAAVEVEGVAHDLAGLRCLQKPAHLVHFAHGGVAFLVARARHVGGDVVEPAVVVDVTGVAAHAEPRSVRQHVPGDVDEGAIAVVVPEAVGAEEVVGHVEVGPAVRVRVPPGDAQAEVIAVDACSFGDVGEAGGAVVAIEVVVLPRRHHGDVAIRAREHVVLLDQLGGNVGLAVTGGHRPLDLLRGIDAVGEQVGVQVAVQVHVAVGRHDAGAREGHARADRHVCEAPVAVVDEEPVRCVVTAHREVEIAIPVDVDEDGAGPPGVMFEAGLGGGVAKLQLAQVQVVATAAHRTGEVDLGEAIAGHIAQGHATTRAGVGQDIDVAAVSGETMLEVDARARGGQAQEARAGGGVSGGQGVGGERSGRGVVIAFGGELPGGGHGGRRNPGSGHQQGCAGTPQRGSEGEGDKSLR